MAESLVSQAIDIGLCAVLLHQLVIARNSLGKAVFTVDQGEAV